MATLEHEDHLQKMFSNVNEWLKFAEAKNFGLLTLNAAIVFGFTQSIFEEESVIAKTGFYVFSPFAIFSFLAALISLFPILSRIEKGSYTKNWITKFSNAIDKEKAFENIHYYGYLKDINKTEFEAKYLEKVGSNKTFTQYEKELVNQILYNSRITWLKYQLFKIGAFLFLVGIIAFVLALPLFIIFG